MNNDFLIIDAHVHTYRNAEIGRQALGAFGSGCLGTVRELEETMAKANISHAVTANFTPIQEMKTANIEKLPSGLKKTERVRAVEEIEKKMIARMERINRWTCEIARENPNLVPLISVDILQSPEEMVEELTTKVSNMGAGGLKLHPIVNGYSPADKRLWPVYARAESLGLPILFHAGASDVPGYENKYGRPSQFKEVAGAFPELTIVLAHLGKGHYGESIELAKKHPSVFFDTSGCFYENTTISEKKANEVYEIIRRVGIQRVMFGSDWPWHDDPLKDIRMIEKMAFRDQEKAMILGLNAQRIYKI